MLKRIFRPILAATFAAVVGAAGSGLEAQDLYGRNQADVQGLLNRIEAQEARIQQLEAQKSGPTMLPAVSSEAATSLDRRLQAVEAAMKNNQPVDDEDDGWEEVTNGWDTPKLRGRLHFDYVNFADQDAASEARYGDLQNYTEFRRLRLGVGGTGYGGIYDYRVELEFEPERGATYIAAGNDPAVALSDVYFTMYELPVVGSFRIGYFKEPYSLAELTSSNDYSFMERPLPVLAFSPSRRAGMMFQRVAEDENMTLATGAFFDDPNFGINKESVSDRLGVDVPIRATWLPWYSAEGRHLFHTGLAYIYRNTFNNTARFRTFPEVHECRDATGVDRYFVDTGAFALNDYHTLNTELAWVAGSFSIQNELTYVRCADDINYYGTYIEAGYLWTGESRPYDRHYGIFKSVDPLENFWIVDTGCGRAAGWGAWESIIRYSYLDLSDSPTNSAYAGTLQDLTLGMNWYWNKNTRVMFNWIHAFGDTQVGGPNNTDILGTRFEFFF